MKFLSFLAFFGNNKSMKRVLLVIFATALMLAGCENYGLRCVHLSNLTQGLSANYAVKMVLDDDERVNDKSVDVQIKSSIDNLVLNFGEEGEEKTSIVLKNADEWYNLTILLSSANGTSGKESYEKFAVKGNRTYLFEVENEAEVAFRVVVGEAVLNDSKTGYILTSTETISNVLSVKAKPNEGK